jgi:hypothetical protein
LSFAGIGVEGRGLVFEPEEECGDLGMARDGLEGIEFPFEGLFRERSVEEAVAAAAELGEGLSDLLSVEVTSHAAVIVSGFGDEVMGGQVGHLTFAQFAGLVWIGQGLGQQRG